MSRMRLFQWQIYLCCLYIGAIGHGNQRPEIKIVWAFMPVLVTSNFNDDSIKNERASIETPFSHYKSMGNFLDLKGS